MDKQVEEMLQKMFSEIKKIHDKVDFLLEVYKQFEEETDKFKQTDKLLYEEMQELNKKYNPNK